MKIIALILVLFCCGCSPFEVRETIFGMNIGDMKRLDNKQFSAVIKGTDLNVVYDKIIVFLQEHQVHFFQQDKKRFFIVANDMKSIYPFCIDTTKVAIHLTVSDTEKIRIDVASRNHILGEKVSQEIFAMLGADPVVEEAAAKDNVIVSTTKAVVNTANEVLSKTKEILQTKKETRSSEKVKRTPTEDKWTSFKTNFTPKKRG